MRKSNLISKKFIIRTIAKIYVIVLNDASGCKIKITPITNINIDKAIEEYKNLFILLNTRLLLSNLILNYFISKVNIQNT